MQAVAEFLADFVGWVWGTPLVVVLTAAGLVFSVRMLGVQWRILTHGVSVIRGKYDDPSDPGNLSHFQALCAALSATIGLGNIAGVAVAVAAGGPGAVFWMWVVGFVGMATKFTTCSLAVMYRSVDATGTHRGGPMWYIEKGLGPKWKPLAIAFAILGAVASFGGGNMFQANQVADIYGKHFGIPVALTGLVLAVLTGMVIIGGIKRIGQVAGRLVPAMCSIYVLGAVVIILMSYDRVPDLLAMIFRGAFGGTAMGGAFAGVVVREVIVQGARRACFSNEAGLGSAPMAHATARTNEPIREGIVAGIGPFVDTIVICTMTALVILLSGSLFRAPIGQVISVSDPHVIDEDGTRQVTVTLTVQPRSLAETEGAAPRLPALRGEEQYFVRAIGPDGKPVRGKDGKFVAVSVAGPRPDFANPTPIKLRATAPNTTKERDELTGSRALTVGSEVYLARTGVTLTAYAFDQGIPSFGTYFVPLAVFLFALSTLISWSFYGETCTEYLFGQRAVLPFKLVYVAAALIGAIWKIGPILDFSDILFGFMVVPNLLASVLLSGKVAAETKRYFQRLGSGEFDVAERGGTRGEGPEA